MAGRIPVPGASNDTNTPPQSNESTIRESLDKGVRLLESSFRIGIRKDSYPKHRRLVTLQTQDIFDSLVDIYSEMFHSQWKDFRRVAEAYPPQPPADNNWSYLARVYISHWLIDLYVSNQIACYPISPIAFSQHFSHEEDQDSSVYDSFLQLLTTSLKPTRIVGTLEDSLFIPIIHDNPQWDAPDNPFVLDNFLLNTGCFKCILTLMTEKRIGWNISTTTDEVVGRPFWLFDWHSNDQVCAWFPFEENFNLEDVCLAYIVGVACTPKLGPKDVDDWQAFPYQNNVPALLNPADYVRATPRNFYGAYEITTIEQGIYTFSSIAPGSAAESSKTASKRPRLDGSAPREPTIPGNHPQPMELENRVQRFRLTTHVYFYRVILDMSRKTRMTALRKIIINETSAAPE